MPKISASTRLDPPVAERLGQIAEVERRSMSDLIATCVERYLPTLEKEVKAKLKAIEELNNDNDPPAGKRQKKAA